MTTRPPLGARTVSGKLVMDRTEKGSKHRLIQQHHALLLCLCLVVSVECDVA
jgi:hypothetical protein